MASVVLIEAARDGDPAALETLLMQCRTDIRRYASRSCSSASDAEDATQEVMIILYRRLGALRAAAALSRWLFVAVHRECLRLARLQGLGYADLDEVANELRFATQPVQHIRLEVLRALRSLPEIYRLVIVLRDFEELTMREIADRLGISTANAKVRLHRARHLVREYLMA